MAGRNRVTLDKQGNVVARTVEYSGLKFTDCQFHRNGCAGAGFYAVRMEWRSGRERYRGTAVVFDEDEHIAVIVDGEHGPDLSTKFRYEDFAVDLRTYVETPAAQALAFPHLARAA